MSMFVFFTSLLCINIYFVFYPLFLICCIYIFKKIKPVNKVNVNEDNLPVISMLIVARNAEKFVGNKIDNCINLNYPNQKKEILFFSDGSEDDTLSIVRRKNDVQIFYSEEHKGKINALNILAVKAKGDILVFTDVDAILDENCLYEIVANLSNKDIGGVCGKRIITKRDKNFEVAQRKYFEYSSFLSTLETKIDSVTSNEGKLYAIKRKLFSPILDATTDDLFVCLSVISKHYRFIFDSSLATYIPIPSRSIGHEIKRRRRIVSTSLRGIFNHYFIFNFSKYGIYSINLFISKVLKRLMPFFLIVAFVSNAFLWRENRFFKMSFILQCLFYTYPILFYYLRKYRFFNKTSEIITYFIVGNIGTLLGVIDFILGKKIDKWEPEKSV